MCLVLAATMGLASAASAQTTRPVVSSAVPRWKSGNCESSERHRTLSRRKELDRIFQPFRMPTTLPELHRILRTSAGPHDAYLQLPETGNEQTVPLLLDRLRLDYGVSEPVEVPGWGQGIICTQGHLIDALRAITNTDQGYYYPRWAAWWKANQKLPRHRWIFDGFVAGGLHPVDPIDERFGLELVGALTSERLYFRPNARRLLASVPAVTRAGWVASAAMSDDRFHRLGALAELRDIDQTGHEDLLRTLAADSDLEIRRQALSVLNARLVKSPATRPSADGCFCRVDESGIESVLFAGDLLIVAAGDRVRAFDTETRRELWSRYTGQGIGELAVSDSRQVILASEGGAILALDLRGGLRWRRPADNENRTERSNNVVRKLLRYADDLVVVRSHTLERLDLNTGETKSTYKASGSIMGADATDRSMCLIDADGLHCLSGKNREFSNGRSVSVSQDLICTTEGVESDQLLNCLSASALSELWKRPFQSYRFDMTLQQDGPRLYFYTNDGLTALRSIDGAILWATAETWVSNALLPTEYGLLTQDNTGKPELRDPKTGEIRRIWPQTRVSKAAVHGKWAAIADAEGVLWLLNLSSQGKPR